ncbi:MAG: hypothetical protein QM775_26495 [Pirellulales bacterium]
MRLRISHCTEGLRRYVESRHGRRRAWRSGKTHMLLATYREALRAQGAGGRLGGTLWLSPNRRAAEQVRERLLAEGLVGCFSPGIQTFEQFARRVTAAADRDIRPIDDRMKRLLLEQLLRIVGHGQIAAFRRHRSYAGFPGIGSPLHQ